ncbi:MAG: hypothetical protein KGL39_52995 [Patescibacteria group bacterium]|nr:hypothetical protein [Patescibacteria group bacterium]
MAKDKKHGIAIVLNLGAKAAEEKAKKQSAMPQDEPDGDEGTCPHCGQAMPMQKGVK